jgi:hypothetical protein
MHKVLKTFNPGEIRTRDLLFRCPKLMPANPVVPNKQNCPSGENNLPNPVTLLPSKTSLHKEQKNAVPIPLLASYPLSTVFSLERFQ